MFGGKIRLASHHITNLTVFLVLVTCSLHLCCLFGTIVISTTFTHYLKCIKYIINDDRLTIYLNVYTYSRFCAEFVRPADELVC